MNIPEFTLAEIPTMDEKKLNYLTILKSSVSMKQEINVE